LTDELPVANFIVGPKRQQYSMVTYLAMEGHWDSDYHDIVSSDRY